MFSRDAELAKQDVSGRAHTRCEIVRALFFRPRVLLTGITVFPALGELARRIAELEGALSESHALHSASTHRLLQADLLALKEPYLPSGFVADSVPPTGTQSPASVSSKEGPARVSVKEEEMPASRGSLSIDPFGRTRYYGTAALSSVRELSALSHTLISHAFAQYLVEASQPLGYYFTHTDLIY
jgi:hypothetical protein